MMIDDYSLTLGARFQTNKYVRLNNGVLIVPMDRQKWWGSMRLNMFNSSASENEGQLFFEPSEHIWWNVEVCDFSSLGILEQASVHQQPRTFRITATVSSHLAALKFFEGWCRWVVENSMSPALNQPSHWISALVSHLVILLCLRHGLCYLTRVNHRSTLSRHSLHSLDVVSFAEALVWTFWHVHAFTNVGHHCCRHLQSKRLLRFKRFQGCWLGNLNQRCWSQKLPKSRPFFWALMIACSFCSRRDLGIWSSRTRLTHDIILTSFAGEKMLNCCLMLTLFKHEKYQKNNETTETTQKKSDKACQVTAYLPPPHLLLLATVRSAQLTRQSAWLCPALGPLETIHIHWLIRNTYILSHTHIISHTIILSSFSTKCCRYTAVAVDKHKTFLLLRSFSEKAKVYILSKCCRNTIQFTRLAYHCSY